MPRKSLESLSPSDVAEAMSQSEALERVRQHRPSAEDYYAEGVIDSRPEPDAEGRVDIPISGHENVMRALKMNEEANRMEAAHFDARRESPLKRDYQEAKAERRARKFHRARASIVVPEMPWKRKKRMYTEED